MFIPVLRPQIFFPNKGLVGYLVLMVKLEGQVCEGFMLFVSAKPHVCCKLDALAVLGHRTVPFPLAEPLSVSNTLVSDK